MNLSTDGERKKDRQRDRQTAGRKQRQYSQRQVLRNMTQNRFFHSLSVNQSSGHPVIQKYNRPQPFIQEIHHQSVSQSVSPNFSQPASFSVCHLVNKSSPSVSRPNSQPVKYLASQPDSRSIRGSANQPVTHPARYRCGSTMEAELRIMPISAICASQPANQPASLLYLQSCCTVPSNPFFSLLSLLSFPFNLS